MQSAETAHTIGVGRFGADGYDGQAQGIGKRLDPVVPVSWAPHTAYPFELFFVLSSHTTMRFGNTALLQL